MQQINQQYRTVAGVLQHGFAAPPGVRAAAASVARLATPDAAGRQPASAPFHPHEFLPLFGPCVGASLCTGGCSASHDDTEYYWELCPFLHVIQAASEADIVSCATLATQPVIEGAWLRPHGHLDLIGSFTPQMREADDAAFVGAKLFIDTREALQKSGELLGPMSRGVFAAADVAGELADLAAGRVQGRTETDGRTVFKAVGTALEDLAAAILVYESIETA